MISKNLTKFAQDNWDHYKTTISNASKSDAGVILVESPIEIYNFDEISKLYSTSTSADGIFLEGNNTQLVEFKSGFKQKITKDKFNPEIGTCKHSKTVCEDYWNLFWENQDRKIQELIMSIRMKAIESYITLEKQILPICDNYTSGKQAKVTFTAVIDEDGAEGLEDAMADVAGCEVTNNRISDIRKSFKRLTKRKDANRNDYLYDEIRVLTVAEFSEWLKTVS
ncbi:MAG: hypothetical protein E7607_06335 [Ruminococcaceae bacterium]|nr:hypothetical protein [Oscillospiraceae bacterium]